MIGRSNNGKIKSDTTSKAAVLIGTMGYELEAVKMIGQDPDTKAIHYVVLGRKPDSSWQDSQFATWKLIDWSSHRNRNDRKRGASIAFGRYQIPNDRAMSEFEKRCNEELSSYVWVYPGSRDLIPGCKRCV